LRRSPGDKLLIRLSGLENSQGMLPRD